MKKKIFLVLAVLSAGAMALHADDQIRYVQEQLKAQGFYYGNVDGEPGAETTAAIRRYQIRNALPVTGTLDQQTLDALKGGSSSAPSSVAPAPQPLEENASQPQGQPTPAVTESDRAFLQKPTPPGVQPPVAPVAAPRQQMAPPPMAIPPEPPDVEAQFVALFRRTPYETAPLEVQQATLKNAQLLLSRERFYGGSIDGLPGPGTTRAIALYQDNNSLVRTGRLDLDTLSQMRLLPGGRHGGPAMQPFYPARPVYRGIWVR